MKLSLIAMLLLGSAAATAGCNRETRPPALCGAPQSKTTAGAAAPDLDPGMVAGTIDGHAITVKELDAHSQAQLARLHRKFQSDEFEERKHALEDLMITRLVRAAADKEGMTEEAWLDKHIAAATPEASEADARKFYDENSARLGGHTFDEAKAHIVAFLTKERRQDAAAKVFEGLEAKAKIEIGLEAPTVEVAAVGPSLGPKDAPVTIVEFSDFQCPFCSKVEPTLKRVMTDYAGKVRFVFRDYPLPFHEHAAKASEASHCAEAQGKYWPMHDAMFAHQDQLGVDGLEKLAAGVGGLDQAKFDSCLATGQMADAVAGNEKAGEAAGVSGTPHFFVNGRSLTGAVPYEDFKKVIDGELAKGPVATRSPSGLRP
jgi:protein-disulfide isomerase